MGAAHSASEEVRELEGKTGFSSDQIEQLHRRFKQLSGDQPTIRKENFNNVPSVCVGQMEPDQVYEGITFEDFLKIWQGIDIETKMHIRFLNMETIALCH